MEQRFAAVWALTCEAYGIDPDNPPPMRKDIVRKSFYPPKKVKSSDDA